MLTVTVFFYILLVLIYVVIEKMRTYEKQSLNLLWSKLWRERLALKDKHGSATV